MLLYGALLVAFLWLTKKYTKKVFLIIPCIGMLLILLPHSNVGLEVTFLDVGQGDGIYIETNNGTTYLIDGGSSDISKVGLYRLQPFLLSQGTDRIDYAIMSHSDNDHINGLKELMDHSKIKIKHLVLPYLNQKDEAYKEFEQLAKNSGVMLQYIRAGDSLLDGNIRMICLHPSSNYIAPSANAYSTVLSISYGEFDLLLTGDLQVDGEKKVEEILKTPSFWGQYGMNPPKNYEVLKVAHHGSRYSTMEEFLSMINPKYSIISCGENNTYGHPHEELLARLKEIGSRRLITYETGAITIKTDGVRLEMTQFR